MSVSVNLVLMPGLCCFLQTACFPPVKRCGKMAPEGGIKNNTRYETEPAGDPKGEEVVGATGFESACRHASFKTLKRAYGCNFFFEIPNG